nr:TIGR03087 family PEP-CTERM/XrtA system glycosyltransferase [uncultured Novosphingobium sp.]
MGEILFLAHRIPFPPDRGDKIRSHNLFKALARLAPVHLGCFEDDAADRACEQEMAALAASHILLDRGKTLPIAGLQALAKGQPLSLTAFHDRRMAGWVNKVLRSRPIETIFVFSGQMAQYVPEDFRGRLIVDLVDVDSAKFEAYGARGSGFRSWMERREGRLLRAEEARIAWRADRTLLVSKAEAALFAARLEEAMPGRSTCRVEAVGNGIDSVLFDPARTLPEPRLAVKEGAGGPRIVFTGQMDYAPNIAAVERAITRILPRIRARLPRASLHVVGRNPPPSLLSRHGRDGVHIWGRVEDIRPWLAAADMALVPLEIARGVQNKVLEAMAMELPVVLSPGAATGIEAEHGRHFFVAESDEALANAVVLLAEDPQSARAMGLAAREWILAHASWQAALASLPRMIGLQTENLIDAA